MLLKHKYDFVISNRSNLLTNPFNKYIAAAAASPATHVAFDLRPRQPVGWLAEFMDGGSNRACAKVPESVCSIYGDGSWQKCI